MIRWQRRTKVNFWTHFDFWVSSRIILFFFGINLKRKIFKFCGRLPKEKKGTRWSWFTLVKDSKILIYLSQGFKDLDLPQSRIQATCFTSINDSRILFYLCKWFKDLDLPTSLLKDLLLPLLRIQKTLNYSLFPSPPSEKRRQSHLPHLKDLKNFFFLSPSMTQGSCFTSVNDSRILFYRCQGFKDLVLPLWRISRILLYFCQ